MRKESVFFHRLLSYTTLPIALLCVWQYWASTIFTPLSTKSQLFIFTCGIAERLISICGSISEYGYHLLCSVWNKLPNIFPSREYEMFTIEFYVLNKQGLTNRFVKINRYF